MPRKQAAEEAASYLCGEVAFHEVENGVDTRFEPGEPYTGRHAAARLKQELIVPAPAGSSQPGSEEEGASA